MTMRRRDFLGMGPLVVVPLAAMLGFGVSPGHAQGSAETVKVGLLVPLSGIYARPGQVMRMGAELGVEDINAAGGIEALGGAKLELVVLDSGDTTEKAKNAAQRMVAEHTDLVAATGSYLSSFTLAVTEVTERAQLPMLTLSYSDKITDRGFHYIFQTSATSGSQAEQSLPTLMELAKAAGTDPKTVAIVTDNTAASISSVKPMRERLLAELGLELVVDETFTPPLADATPLVQQLRATRPDLFFFLPTVISDAKLVLEKMNEFGLGQGRIPTISFGIAIAEPDLLNTMGPELLQGVMAVVANWGSKGHEADDRPSQGTLRRALDDPERDLDLRRHVDPEGCAGEGRQGGSRGGGRGAAHAGWGPIPLLPGRRAQVRREGAPGRRRADHHPVAGRGPGHGLSARAGGRRADLAEGLSHAGSTAPGSRPGASPKAVRGRHARR